MTRTFDLTPFTRATVGFDRLFDELDRQFANSAATGYPPYNIVAINENEYMISLAVAGFGMGDLEITKDGNVLTVEGTAPNSDESVRYLHKGIAGRGFRRQFTLADYVEVESASLELGMLNIRLVRRIPEELQPKRIAINAPSGVIDSK
jgi:molecular chaperone IbpA